MKTITHARPKEEDSVLGRGSSSGDQCSDCIDDGGLGGTKGDTSTPGIFSLLEGLKETCAGNANGGKEGHETHI